MMTKQEKIRQYQKVINNNVYYKFFKKHYDYKGVILDLYNLEKEYKYKDIEKITFLKQKKEYYKNMIYFKYISINDNNIKNIVTFNYLPNEIKREYVIIELQYDMKIIMYNRKCHLIT